MNLFRLICLICMLTFFKVGFSQSVGIGTLMPDSSAILDISSSDRGLLIPRMTTLQRLAVGAITTGLIVFDITTSTFWYAENGSWTELKSKWVRNGNMIYNANTGNVGIGITDPTASLDVLGTIRSNNPGSSPMGSYISLSSPSTDPGIIMSRGDGNGGTARRWDLKIDNDESFRILDNTGGKLRLMINTAGRVSMGTTSPHSSAALDIQSTTKGFLPPRWTLAERNSYASNPQGLMIWCTDCGVYGEVQIYNGSYWTNMVGDTASGSEIGDYYQGGIVAYVYQPGDPGYVAGEVHGLIAAQNDLIPSAWGCYGTNLPGCSAIALGTGNQNTIEIMDGCGDPGIAAEQCYDLLLNGYTDWFLPSKNELIKLYNKREVIGGFLAEVYWSSSESSANNANAINFAFGYSGIYPKQVNYGVRPIRYF